MDNLHIPSTILRRSVPKDQRVLHQQRAVLMNSPPRLAMYHEHQDELAVAAERRATNADKNRRRTQEEQDTMTIEELQEYRDNIARYDRRRRTKTVDEIAAMTADERAAYEHAQRNKKPRHKKKTQAEINTLSERDRLEYEIAEMRCERERQRRIQRRIQERV